MTEGSLLYSDQDVEVTSQSIRMGEVTYWPPHIISVRLRDVDPRVGAGPGSRPSIFQT